ncbi:hypothetical protein Syun_009361 [Stephania yunnanensis]|uniref:Uncharacterized protein n=1 Tax=Stephania yunnanensis TaxID=152371 RepID=A0AAP0KGU0_9MAGN
MREKIRELEVMKRVIFTWDSHGGKRERRRRTWWRGKTDEGGQRRHTPWRGQTAEVHMVESAEGGGAHRGEG